MSKKSIKTRISPSPTGSLHLGGCRTALYNYLFAKQNQGIFLLRIEDTDQARSTAESERVIVDGLRWLGLDWQEGLGANIQTNGPYRQSERLHIYQEFAKFLIKEGKAYKCYCSAEDLNLQRKVAEAEKKFFKYPGTCRDKPFDASRSGVIRFKAPTEGTIFYQDMIFGKMQVPNLENQDFILIREDGFPLYNFAAAIDDHLMEITHIIRGREHSGNTPLQILLYQAFGWDIPQFAHLPLMLAQNGEKLSKRHAAVSVAEYQNLGYTPSAVLNYLAKFGWGSGDEEIFTLDQLVEKFDLSACKRSDGKFDPKKFSAIQFQHLKSPALTSDDAYLQQVLPFLRARGLGEQCTPDKLLKALPLVRARAHNLVEAAEEFEPFLTDTVPNQSESFQSTLQPQLQALYQQLNATPEDHWREVQLRETVRGWLAEHNLSLKEIGGFLRTALTGRSHSPELFQVMDVLGRARSLQRLETGLKKLNFV